ncbi:hypothetical protein HD554DRAFT_2242167 [Boletus coccyginus]|nr:hypothetical protein HD554DRAFT_2242167 [Boletus coccyginus]
MSWGFRSLNFTSSMSLVAQHRQHVVDTPPTDNTFYRVLRGIEGIAALCGYHALRLMSNTYPKKPRTSWLDHEVNSLLDFLYTRREKLGDAGVFPLTVYHEGAALFGNDKTSSTVSSKWGNLKQIYLSIQTYLGRSGTHWDNVNGANICSRSELEDWNQWIQTTVGRRMVPFKNKGWRFYDKVHSIFPVGPEGVTGTGAFMPPQSSGWDQPEEEGWDDAPEEYDQVEGYSDDGDVQAASPRPRHAAISAQSRRSTASRPGAMMAPELPDLNHRFTLAELADVVDMYEDILPPTSSSVSSRSRKRRVISQVSEQPRIPPTRSQRGISRRTPSSHASHPSRRQPTPATSFHSSAQQSVASSSRPSKRTRANPEPPSNSAPMAVITGLSGALRRIADIVSDAQPPVDKQPAVSAPLISATNITSVDAIPLLQSDHALSVDARAYLADLFMENSEVLRVYVLVDAEARHRFAELQYAKHTSKDTTRSAAAPPMSSSMHIATSSSSSIQHPPAPARSNSFSFDFGDFSTDFATTESSEDALSSSVFMPPLSSAGYAHTTPSSYMDTPLDTYAPPLSDYATSSGTYMPPSSDYTTSSGAYIPPSSDYTTMSNLPGGEGGDTTNQYVYTSQEEGYGLY